MYVVVIVSTSTTYLGLFPDQIDVMGIPFITAKINNTLPKPANRLGQQSTGIGPHVDFRI